MSTSSVGDREVMPRKRSEKLRLAMLIGLVLYVPYQLYLDFSTGLPGLNGANVLFFGALFLMRNDPSDKDLKTPLKGLFIFYFVTISVGFIWALTSGGRPIIEDINYWKSLIFYPLLYFLFFHGIRDRRMARAAFGALLFVVFLASLQAVRQGLDYGLGNFNETRRAAGPFSRNWTNANRAGVFYAMFTPIMVVAFAFYKGKRWIRIACAAGAGLGVFATFVTYSRQSYFILAAVLFLFFLRRNLVVGIFVGLAIMSYESWLPDAAIQRIQMTESSDSPGTGEAGGELDESTESRFIIWTGAEAMILEHPLGVGLQRFRENLGRYSSIKNMDAHNYYILTTAEAGIPGAISLLVLLVGLLTLAQPLIRVKADRGAQILGWSHRLCTLSLIAGNLFGSAFNFGELMSGYWVLSGIVARYRYLIAQAPAADSERVLPLENPYERSPYKN